MEGIEKSLILEALQECDNNISRSSERLGIKRQTLQHKLRKYGIKIEG
jgi:arginine utilization regulatory protein